MPFFDKIAKTKDQKITRDLKSTLDFLLQKIDTLKDKKNLNEFLEIVSKNLRAININIIVSIIDDKKEGVYIKYINLHHGQESPTEVELAKKIKINFNKLPRYRKVIEKNEPVFTKDRLNQIKIILPEIKPYIEKLITKEANSIITPLTLKGEVIGFFEFISPDIIKEDIEAVKDFSKNLLAELANLILFQEIGESEKRYRNLFEKSQQGFAVINARKKLILDMNDKFCKITGYTKDEILQANLLLFFDNKEKKKFDDFIKDKLIQKRQTVQLPLLFKTVFLTKKREKKFIRVSVVQFITHNECFIGIEDITERHLSQQALKASEDKFRDIFEKASEGIIYLDIKGKIIDVNKKALEIMGYDKNEILNKNFQKLEIFTKDILKNLLNIFKKIIKDKKTEINFSFTNKTGKEIILKCTGVLMEKPDKSNFVSVILNDVTQEKRYEQTLKESEEKYRKLVSNMHDGVVIINAKGYISFANNVLIQITGYSENELKKIHFSKLLHPDDYNMVVKRFNDRLDGKSTIPNYQFRIIDKNGKEKYIDYYGSPITEKGKRIGIQATVRNITENIKLQKTIEESSKNYKEVIDSIQDSICVIDANMKITGYNTAFAGKVKMPIKKIKGLGCHQVIHRYENNILKNHCTPDHGRRNCAIREVLKNGEARVYTEKNTDKNKKTKYHTVSIYPSKINGNVYQVVLIIRDITERKLAEEEIRRLSEFNQRILDSSPVSIVVLNKQGKIISSNKLAKKLMEESGETLYGQKLTNTKEIKTNPYLLNKYKELLKEGKSFYYGNLSYATAKRKEKKYLNLIAVPLFNNLGKVEGAISMALDNTEAVINKGKLENLNKNLENNVIERTRQLDIVNKELSQALELKSKFISDASHELRTPLTIIQGNLDLAVRESNKNKNEIPEVYSLVNKEIERMSGVLTDLTMLTYAEANAEHTIYEKVNLNSLVATILQSIKVLALEKNIKVKQKNIKRLKKLSVMGDELQLEKLLLNILRNAIKYTNKKGWIEVALEEHPDEARIIVKDNGIGIPKEDLPYIFERFYRVDKARSRNEGGTGLGLSICKWIAETHGGHIDVESKTGKGSKFTIHLPLDYRNK